MASFSTLPLIPFFISKPRDPNPRSLPARIRNPFKCSAQTDQKSGGGGGGRPRDSPPAIKKSFAVATGEIFLGLSSILARRRKPIQGPVSAPFTTAGGGEEPEEGNRIASVVEDSIDAEVIWEQRVKDVEAERDRKKVTSPGFSFSAAGLLFPYHLGAAQFLIEKGYIKVNSAEISPFITFFFLSSSLSISPVFFFSFILKFEFLLEFQFLAVDISNFSISVWN